MSARLRPRLSLSLLAVVILTASCAKREWKEFSSTEGRFSVMMPDTPKEETSEVSTAVGPVKLHTFSANGAMRTFAVAYSEFPTGQNLTFDAERMFDGSRDEVLKHLSATLKSQQTIRVDGHPARLLVMENGSLQIKMKLIWVEPRLYQAIVVAQKLGGGSEDVDRFLDSFKLR